MLIGGQPPSGTSPSHLVSGPVQRMTKSSGSHGLPARSTEAGSELEARRILAVALSNHSFHEMEEQGIKYVCIPKLVQELGLLQR